jgi:hypothetical protein
MTDQQQVVPTEMSVEEKLEFERGSQKSRLFLERHPEYFNSPENNTALTAEIKRLGNVWSLESLEQAYSNIKTALAEKPVPPEPEENNFGYSISRINQMSGQELIQARKSPEIRAAIDRVLSKYNASRTK